jgi:hypothetical protein
MRLFQPGEPVVMRHVRDDWRWAAPMHVVEDRGDFVALYVQPGSEYSTMGNEAGELTRNFVTEKTPIRRTWVENHGLTLVRFGDEHATVLYWREGTWEFRCWYINFQDPLRRYEGGFESMDLTLDMLIAPDRRGWRWKDEDEFVDIGITGGWYSHEQLAHLKQYGRGVLDQARAGLGVFGEPWPDWRPDPSWGPLRLPEGWDADLR